MLDHCAAEIGTSVYQAGRDFHLSSMPSGGIQLTVNEISISLPAPSLRGSHQIENAGLAAACLAYVTRQEQTPSALKKIDLNALANGTTQAVWPGRVQPLHDGAFAKKWPHQTIWLDGAHNAHGANALAKTLGQIHSGKWNIICGALNTRDPVEFLAPLAGLASRVRFLTIPGQEGSLRASSLSDTATALGLDSAPSTNIEAAFATLDRAHPVIICGSLYLAGHVLMQNETLPN